MNHPLPPINHYTSRKEWEDACWKILTKSSEILTLFITARERHYLVMRAAVADRLREGKSYKKIGDELWLSPQTVSGIKKALQENGYRSYRERGKTERKKKSPNGGNTQKERRWRQGTPVKTKYGTVYLP